MKKFLFVLLLLVWAAPAPAEEGRFYRAVTVSKSYDDTYALVDSLRGNHHYGQSLQCVKYPSRGECALYNSMANRNAYYIYIEPLNDSDTRVAVYITDLADSRMQREIDQFFKQLKQGY